MKKKQSNLLEYSIIAMLFLFFGIIVGNIFFTTTQFVPVNRDCKYCYDSVNARDFATLSSYTPKKVYIGTTTYPTTGDCNEPDKHCFITSYKQVAGELNCACWEGS